LRRTVLFERAHACGEKRTSGLTPTSQLLDPKYAKDLPRCGVEVSWRPEADKVRENRSERTNTLDRVKQVHDTGGKHAWRRFRNDTRFIRSE
jgi:hypothetical protein